MQHYIIIRINRPEFECDDFQDLICDEFENYYSALKKFVQSLGAELFYTENYTHQINCQFAFAEVEHSLDLSAENKAQLIELLKKFFQDADIQHERVRGRNETYMNEYNILKMVKFHQSADESIML
jgi:hypothetical protein